MKLTIIPIDNAVYKDDVVFHNLNWEGTPVGVHALQWVGSSGWIEFVDNATPNDSITVLPTWANNALDAWDVAWTIANTPVMPIITASDNKERAKLLLSQTDWATLPDVLNTSIVPYLTNQAEYLSYRVILRDIVLSPVDGEMVFPIKPTSQWTK